MPSITIDGVDITGCTIDGTEVTEITIDGVTVWKAFGRTLGVIASPTYGALKFGLSGALGKLYLFGGMTAQSEPSEKVQEYNPTTNTWNDNKLADSNLDLSIVAVTVGTNIHVIGSYEDDGTNEYYYNMNRMYNPSANTMTAKAFMPFNGIFKTATNIGSLIYCMGGGTD